MMTSSNGNFFRVTGPLCGEFTGPGEFPAQRPVTRSFDVFFDLRPNKRLSKQPWGWLFETPSWSLWRQCNETVVVINYPCHERLTFIDKGLWSLNPIWLNDFAATIWQHIDFSPININMVKWLFIYSLLYISYLVNDCLFARQKDNIDASYYWHSVQRKHQLGILSAQEIRDVAWWRHQMETFSALLAICAGNSPVHGEFPAQRPVTWSFDIYFVFFLIAPIMTSS